MRSKEELDRSNARIFKLMSIYLNLAPDYVDKEMMDAMTEGVRTRETLEYSYASLVAAACGLDPYDNPADKAFFRNYFLPMMHLLDSKPYCEDEYYRNIKLPEGKCGNWTFEKRVCRAYEGFVFDDPIITDDGRVIPQIGFFEEDYPYPAVLEGGREWMTLMPNETNTTKPALDAARGRVLTFGLGLGYFAYMASIKDEVTSVTVVERSKDAIALFKEHILPQFPDPKKVTVVCSDAFEFAENEMARGEYDMVFTDLWHDPSDGVELYLKMKEYENKLPNAQFVYWIEKTLKLYM
ncbi:MAG: hypothetical protein IKJ80_06820 [Clostridia bacterium]|nr:hypothetical protein [Clostridia bacterium]